MTTRIDCATPKMILALAARDALTDVPGCYEWARENGEQVRVAVDATGCIALWIDGESRGTTQAQSFEQACETVEDLCHKDTIR